MEFPEELWERLFTESALSCRDLWSLGRVSRFLLQIVSKQRIWKLKFQQRWPQLFHSALEVGVSDWLLLYKHRYLTSFFVKQRLRDLSIANVRNSAIYLSYSSFRPLENGPQLEGSENFVQSFVMDELLQILNEKEDKHLTECFYGSQALRCMKHQQLHMIIEEWVRNPTPLEKGAFLLAEWFQTDQGLSWSQLEQTLDQMALYVKAKLQETRPKLPAAKAPLCTEQVLEESLWSPSECRQVLEALNQVFCDVWGFSGNTDDYYNIHNSFLNLALNTKKGIPVTLCILYQAVARRVGIRCDPVGFPSHMMLKFLEHPHLGGDQRWTFIDPFCNCAMMDQSEMWLRKSRIFGTHPIAWNPQFVETMSPQAVVIRMCNNLSRVDERYFPASRETIVAALELAAILEPDNIQNKFLLARAYFHQDMNFDLALDMMTSLQVDPGNLPVEMQRNHWLEMARAKLLELSIMEHEMGLVPKKRSEHPLVKHSVGMIMKHREFDYLCVVAGWDHRCSAPSDWKKRMGVGKLERSDHQPFYNVLVNDGSNRYAAEDNLVWQPNPAEVNHQEVGKHFVKFCGTHYLMNPEKLPEYPEDEEATLQYVMSSYGE